MPTRRARGSVSRSTLIWLIVAAFLIASGVALFVISRKGSRTTPPAGPSVNLDGAPPLPSSTTTPDGAVSSENMRIHIADRDDPSRLAGEMLFGRQDPLPRGRHHLEAPQLWLFLKDGRTLHLLSARGNVKFYAGTNKPESGRFEGGVVARMYAAGVATPTTRPDPDMTAPVMLAYTESMVFDLAVGEFNTDDVVNLSTPDMELQGEGMNVVINEMRESLASVQLGAIGYLHVRAGSSSGKTSDKAAAEPQAQPASTLPAAVPAAPAVEPKPLKVEMYAVNIAGPVMFTVGDSAPQTITADRLFAWARLVGGKLSPKAIAELRRTPPAASSTDATAPSPVSTAEAAPSPSPTPAPAAVAVAPPPATHNLRQRIEKLRVIGPSGLTPLTPISDDDALLTWGGQLVATAVEQTPPELAKEEVAVRFVSESTEPVKLADTRAGATVLCDTVHYGATTAETILTAKKDSVVTIADARHGFGQLEGLKLNLKTGVGQARGAGFLDRREESGSSDRKRREGAQDRLSWKDQMDLQLGPSGSSGGIGAIQMAVFSGEVLGVTGEAEVTGDVLRAWFKAGAAADALLQRVVVEGKSEGRTVGSQEPQSLRADRIDVAFQESEDGKASYPRLLVATGGVEGERTELLKAKDSAERVQQVSTLRCDELEADLARDDRKNVVVTAAVARGDAFFERSDGVRASGEEIRTVIADKVAYIVGADARVEARGASLQSPDLQLDGVSNAVLAKGDGALEHVDTEAGELKPGEVGAIDPRLVGRTMLTWSKGMRYDNTTGEGEVRGGAVAITYPDPFTQNTVRGEQLLILTAPADKSPAKSVPDAKNGDSVLGDVKLLRAEAVGIDAIDGSTPVRATAEQRLYVHDPAAAEQRRLAKLTYIEGHRLVADEQNGDFAVPAPGRALVLDHSVAKRTEERASAGESPFASSTTRGTTFIEWSGSMKMSRATELADVVGGVRITFKPINPSEKPIVLESDNVQAQFRHVPRSADAAGVSMNADEKEQLVRASAMGSVRITAENGDKELLADEATYHAVDEIVEAAATTQYGSVTFLDKTKGIPTIARKLRWNLKTDAVEVIEPMPVAIPGR